MIIGNWENGRINGYGTLKYANGDVYEGDWLEGAMHGHGTYQYSEGDVYVGQWRQDKRHGKGTITYVDKLGNPCEKYEGDWVDNIMNGKGMYKYADGSYYDGIVLHIIDSQHNLPSLTVIILFKKLPIITILQF